MIIKRSIEAIFEKYSNVREKFNGVDIPLTNVENVFYQLVLFLNDPEKYSFNINLFYTYLKDEDLLFAINSVIIFFQKDTYLITGTKKYFINAEELEKENIFNQTMFSKYLQENGLNYNQSKLSVYYNRSLKNPARAKIPRADLVIMGTPYWYESTAELFLKEELSRQQKKKEK